jgi:hypothetical protein
MIMQEQINKLANEMCLNTSIIGESGQFFTFQLINANNDKVLVESSGRTVLLAIENMAISIKRSES